MISTRVKPRARRRRSGRDEAMCIEAVEVGGR
jgi:hypothetical protein